MLGALMYISEKALGGGGGGGCYLPVVTTLDQINVSSYLLHLGHNCLFSILQLFVFSFFPFLNA